MTWRSGAIWTALLTLVIIGMGYVGLPLAREATQSGLSVIGLDISPEVVDGLNQGRSHVDDLADSDVAEMLRRGFFATTDAGQLRRARTIVICVPTPLTKMALPIWISCAVLRPAWPNTSSPALLVILESTTYPGTTDEEIRPMLEAGGWLREGLPPCVLAGTDRPGQPDLRPEEHAQGSRRTHHGVRRRELRPSTPSSSTWTVVRPRAPARPRWLSCWRIPIGISISPWSMRWPGSATNSRRLWDVIAAAEHKPFGFQAFRPGLAWAVTAFPIDPNYLSHRVRAKADIPFRFVELAEEINASMPRYVARRIQDQLNLDGRPLRGVVGLALGVTYKPNIADTRESPAIPLAKILLQQGAVLRFHDPLVKQFSVSGTDIPRVDDVDLSLAEADICVLLQNHRQYDDRRDDRGLTTIFRHPWCRPSGGQRPASVTEMAALSLGRTTPLAGMRTHIRPRSSQSSITPKIRGFGNASSRL